MNKPTLIMNAKRSAMRTGELNQVDILIRLQSPEPIKESTRRSPLNISLVLDRSGSMSGQPLEEAKRCADFVIDMLKPEDRASIIAYDDQVSLLVPSKEVSDRGDFHEAISSIHSGGLTNLHGGWLEGAEQASLGMATDTISRVILLSDGQANKGLLDRTRISQYCNELSQSGVSTSTYGLGRHFNEELMIEMARAGQGNSYYGRTAEDLMDPFREEFDLLSALCAKQIKLTFSTPENVNAEILNKYRRDDSGNFCLPDLAYQGEAWLLVRLKVPATFTGDGNGELIKDLMTVSITYQDLDGNEHELKPLTLELPSLKLADWAALEEDELVVRRLSEIEAANLHEQAQRAAHEGDWQEVQHLLSVAKEKARNNEWLKAVAEKLELLAASEDEILFSKEAKYTSQRMHTRLAGRHELAENLEIPMPSYLRRKTEQGKAGQKFTKSTN